MSDVMDLALGLLGVLVAVTPMWIYGFTDVGFEFPTIMALSTIAALVWITRGER